MPQECEAETEQSISQISTLLWFNYVLDKKQLPQES